MQQIHTQTDGCGKILKKRLSLVTRMKQGIIIQYY